MNCFLLVPGMIALALAGAADAGAAEVEETVQQVIERTNAFRAEQGLARQAVNEALTRAARDFARFMAESGKYGHTADGRQPAQRAAAAGYDYCLVLENLGYLFDSRGFESAELAQGLLQGWKESSEHRESMLDPDATEIGVGLAQGQPNHWFAVQLFGRPKGAAIRFGVENRAGRPIAYQASGRSFSLEPRATRTHTVCRPTELVIERSSGEPYKTRVEGGATYRVADGKVEARTLP